MDFTFTNNPNPGYPTFAFDCITYRFKDCHVNTQCEPDSRNFIRSYAEKIKDGIIVEIGIMGGATLLDLFEICQSNNNKIYGIDPFDKITIFNGQTEKETDVNMQKRAREFSKTNKEILTNIILRYNLSNVISVIDETSKNASIQFKNNSIDLLHIDGDHSADGVYNDLVDYWPKMKKGTGTLIGDDFYWKSVQIGLNRFCQEYNVNYTIAGGKFIIKA
jgi:predicted O-methyltransferase YrrM